MRAPNLVLVTLVMGGCTDDLDPPWQLDHDRIVAIRATPPRMPAEATSHIEVLLGHAGAPTTVLPPDSVEVLSPSSLRTAASGATVTAPPAAELADARTELGLAGDAPVPLVLSIRASGFAATKTVWFGEAAANPTLAGITIAGAPPGAELVLPAGIDVPLAVTADDNTENITWLTSCGTLHDFDPSHAYLRIEPEDPQEGELALIVRDPSGGVGWRVWPLRVARP